MDNTYFALFLEKTNFPEEACKSLTDTINIIGKSLMPILETFCQHYDHRATTPAVITLAEQSGISEYSIWMVILILASKRVQHLYLAEKLFWDTFTDLRYKAQECYDLHGIWGTFVSHWYPIFYKGNIVKLGRMEYETRVDALKHTYTIGDITLGPGNTTIHLHIPTCPDAPFDKAARLESYKLAYEHFCKDGRPLVCICSSWLLYSEYENVFAPGSNIADFRKEFIMMKSKVTDTFGDAWRVFGREYSESVDKLPESTSLQRAFKNHAQTGGSFGHGTGVIIFDGEKLLSQQ